MRKHWLRLLVLGLGACGVDAASEGEPVAERAQNIVYGDDDRLEVYEHPDAQLRALARASVVALIPKARVQISGGGEVRFSAPTLGHAYDLCDGERFMDQPIAADCSGVLIDRDLVVTAAHCLAEGECSDYLYVFDYFYGAAGELQPSGAADLYGCRRLIAQENRDVDYAVVQLDRPVPDRTPIGVRGGALSAGEALSVLGTGSGLPIKIDSGAHVLSPRAERRDYFTLDSDTFEGSSGSAIVDAQYNLVGVLVRGGEDYAELSGRGCQVVNRLEVAVEGELPDGNLRHEEATYAQHAVDGVCAARFASEALCGIAPSCGDGFCTGSETRTSCAQDCDPCDEGKCGPRAEVPFTRTQPVQQRVYDKRAGDCSARGGAPVGRSWLILLALSAALRVRSRVRRAAAGTLSRPAP